MPKAKVEYLKPYKDFKTFLEAVKDGKIPPGEYTIIIDDDTIDAWQSFPKSYDGDPHQLATGDPKSALVDCLYLLGAKNVDNA